MKEKDFNYEEFEKEALERLRQGAPLKVDDGILTPLIKRFLEAAMERREKRSKPHQRQYME